MGGMSKAERLLIAGQSAPTLRARESRRKIKVVDRDGKVVREIDDVALSLKIHERAGIEFSVQDGKRPKRVACESCRRVFAAPTTGKIPKQCVRCRRPCVKCGEAVSKSAAWGAQKDGRSVMCGDCRCPPRLPCGVCGSPASKMSSIGARARGGLAYCSAHKAGNYAPAPILPCATCGAPATRQSSAGARRHPNSRACCELHRGGRLDPLPCAVCGQPSTRASSSNARFDPKRKPYCKLHPRGKTAAT
jgi:hypothetical protein